MPMVSELPGSMQFWGLLRCKRRANGLIKRQPAGKVGYAVYLPQAAWELETWMGGPSLGRRPGQNGIYTRIQIRSV